MVAAEQEMSHSFSVSTFEMIGIQLCNFIFSLLYAEEACSPRNPMPVEVSRTTASNKTVAQMGTSRSYSAI